MATIGLRNFRYGEMNDDGETYKAPATLGGAIECKVSLDIAEAELYADDILKEKATAFKKGTMTLGVDDDDDSIFAVLLGEKVGTYKPSGQEETTVPEYVSGSEDIPKYFGFGQVVPKMINGSRKYKVEWFPKVQFKPYVTDKKTKGDSLEFTTPSIEGTVFENNNKEWRRRATFDSEEQANTYLDSLFVQSA